MPVANLQWALSNPQQRELQGENLPKILETPCGYAMFEVQGQIHTSSEFDSCTMKLGSIDFTLNQDKWTATLTVGNHQKLVGSIVKLSKPLALVRMNSANHQGHIIDIISYKVAFLQRPMAI